MPRQRRPHGATPPPPSLRAAPATARPASDAPPPPPPPRRRRRVRRDDGLYHGGGRARLRQRAAAGDPRASQPAGGAGGEPGDRRALADPELLLRPARPAPNARQLAAPVRLQPRAEGPRLHPRGEPGQRHARQALRPLHRAQPPTRSRQGAGRAALRAAGRRALRRPAHLRSGHVRTGRRPARRATRFRLSSCKIWVHPLFHLQCPGPGRHLRSDAGLGPQGPAARHGPDRRLLPGQPGAGVPRGSAAVGPRRPRRRTMKAVYRALLGLASLVLSASATLVTVDAGAEVPELCMTVLVQQKIDGKKTADGRAAGAVTAGLDKLGICVVNAAKLGGLKKAVEAGKLAGRYEQVDWILDATVDSRKAGEGVLGTSFVRYKAELAAKLILAGSGEQIGEFTTEGEGMDIDPRAAALLAGEQAGRRLVEAWRDKASILMRKPGKMRLVVTGVPDAQEVEAINAALQQVLGVSGAQPLGFAKGTAELELEIAGVSPAELARRIELSRSSGLVVEGYSPLLMRSRFDPTRRMRILVRIGPFENGTGSSDDAWLSTTFPRLIQARLGNYASLEPKLTGVEPRPPAQLADVLPFLEGGGEKEALLYLTGRYGCAGRKKGELQVAVYTVGKPAQLFTITQEGDVRKLLPVIAGAAQTAAARIIGAVLQDDELRTQANGAALSTRKHGRALAAPPRSTVADLGGELTPGS
ncbi:MAG: hypothetical protein FJ125_00140, partial [Deltaproteobacteria bacterium]|nr:hypothetical protein [Deltaproteobacteria bacterium]